MESRISPSNALKVDADRLWATIDRSAKIGRFRGTELRRLALSPEDKRATSSSASGFAALRRSLPKAKSM